MLVYHLLPAKWGLDDLERRRVKVAEFRDLNDPFELVGVELSDQADRARFKSWRKLAVARFGMLCFSRTWRNPVLWSHYADKHKGLCLGFDVPDGLLQTVRYLRKRMPFRSLVRGTGEVTVEPGPLFHLKFKDWQYESEVRRVVQLTQASRDGDHYFWPFGGQLALRKVIVGARCGVDADQLKQALGELADTATLIQARPAFKSFGVVIQHRGLKARGGRKKDA